MTKKVQGNKDDKKQTPAEKNYDQLKAWIRNQTCESIKELENNGKINRQKAASQSGVNKRAFTGQNPKATKLFRRWERLCRKAGLLPKKVVASTTGEGTGSNSGSGEPEFLDPRDAEIARLNNEISKLKQQIYQKDIQLKRFNEFKDVLYREGFY